MIVCIAEKPSVARDIASLLGANRRVVDRGVGYIEGNGYQITWTFGHLCTLKEPQDYSPLWQQWSLSTLPIIPPRFGIKPIDLDNYKRQLDVIAGLMKTATMVINCGDAGQEGELIQRWVLQWAGCTAPVKRLWISSLTDEAIREGFAHLRDAEDFQTLYEAGLARAVGDWLLGMNATRLYTVRYATERGQVLSIGRVQTPTLALIVDRHRTIEHFVPETYWELKTVYRGVTFSAERGKYTSMDKSSAALASIQGQPFEVKNVKQKGGKELPPRLFDLTSLQVACNRKYGMSADETLATIQALYEKKLTTYPRVDTTYLSDDLYPKVRNILVGLVGYRELTTPILAEQTIRKSKKVFDNSKVTDHHAIIPTGQPVHGLSDREAKVFDLVSRHFIAAFYPECEISTTTVLGQVARIPFKATGREVLSPGWRVVFSGGVADDAPQGDHEGAGADDETSASALPAFVAGEQGEHQPETRERQTQPPKPYTEATLLRAMETAGKLVEDEELRELMKENGIGRPSTRANIIETLLKRGYITKGKRSQLHPTARGLQLIDLINYDLLKSAEMTGQWEYKLRQIERRELPATTFIDELKAMVTALVSSVLRPQESTPAYPLCPVCGRGYVVRGRTAYGCSAWAEGCTYRAPLEPTTSSVSTE